MTKNIIIDTDCGMDDIMAIAMIASCQKFKIQGITTVRGLTNPVAGAKNIAKILDFLSYNTNVIAGYKKPINQNRKIASFPRQDVLNSSKLIFLTKLLEKYTSKNILKMPVEDFLFNSINGKTTIICLGPLTNIAKAIEKYDKKFTSKIEGLVIMGGAVFQKGNVAPLFQAEYNIYLDPEAASIVFSSKIPVKLFATDATRLVPATDAFKAEIENLKPKSKYGKIIKSIIVYNKKDFRYFYDPLVAAYLETPTISSQVYKLGLKVITTGKLLGKTLPKSGKRISLVTKINSRKFYNLVKEKMLS